MSKHLLSPSDIESRAKALGISMREVFRRAKCAESTFRRWKIGETSMKLAIYKALVDVTAPVGPSLSVQTPPAVAGVTDLGAWELVKEVELEVRLSAYASAGNAKRHDEMVMFSKWAGKLQRAINLHKGVSA